MGLSQSFSQVDFGPQEAGDLQDKAFKKAGDNKIIRLR